MTLTNFRIGKTARPINGWKQCECPKSDCEVRGLKHFWRLEKGTVAVCVFCGKRERLEVKS